MALNVSRLIILLVEVQPTYRSQHFVAPPILPALLLCMHTVISLPWAPSGHCDIGSRELVSNCLIKSLTVASYRDLCMVRYVYPVESFKGQILGRGSVANKLMIHCWVLTKKFFSMSLCIFIFIREFKIYNNISHTKSYQNINLYEDFFQFIIF